MSILLPTLAIAFAAFCVWLTVRIVNRRERWAKWTFAVLIGLPVLYVLSFGPWCWILSRCIRTDARGIRTAADLADPLKSALPYCPIFLLWWNGPKSIEAAIGWYAIVFSGRQVGPAVVGRSDAGEPLFALYPDF
jgi:hypothetical protein